MKNLQILSSVETRNYSQSVGAFGQDKISLLLSLLPEIREDMDDIDCNQLAIYLFWFSVFFLFSLMIVLSIQLQIASILCLERSTRYQETS